MCFETSAFAWQEAEFITKLREDIATSQRKIEEEEQRPQRYCVAQNSNLLAVKKAENQRMLDKLDRIENGNINLSENNNSLIAELSSGTFAERLEIAKLQVSLCNQDRVYQSASTQEKKQCIRERINNLNALISEIETIEANNRNDRSNVYKEVLEARKRNKNLTSNNCLRVL